MQKRRTRHAAVMVSAMTASLLLGGCGVGSQAMRQSRPASQGLLAGLVLPGDAWLEASSHPGFQLDASRAAALKSRNDGHVGLIDRPSSVAYERQITQTYDRQWTVNGHIGESTYVRTRTIRVSPSN